MVLGTSSGAGKSLMTAALCRVLRRRGETPLPFKGQNMSNNAWVDQAGGEMAYSQALQAWAAGLEPHHAMNPVLLKPQGDSTSEVIHLGRSVGRARAEHYYRDWFRPGWAAIRSGLATLQATHPGGRLVLEGAGSPVEVNLQPRDLTNLRLAQYLRARCLLVADIERGGVFAQIVGTLALLRPVERPLIRGLLINRFRGRRELFEEGRRWLETHTGVPVLGVMPLLDELFPPEDSLDLLERRGRKRGAELEIAVVRLPSLSNFSDLDPLEAEPTVQLRWLLPGEELGDPDAVVVPGCRPADSITSSGPTWRRGARCSASAAGCRCWAGTYTTPRLSKVERAQGQQLTPRDWTCCRCAPASGWSRPCASAAARPSGRPGRAWSSRALSCTAAARSCWRRATVQARAGNPSRPNRWPPIPPWAGGKPGGSRVGWWPAPTCMACLRAAPGAGAGSTSCAAAATWHRCGKISPTMASSANTCWIGWPMRLSST